MKFFVRVLILAVVYAGPIIGPKYNVFLFTVHHPITVVLIAVTLAYAWTLK